MYICVMIYIYIYMYIYVQCVIIFYNSILLFCRFKLVAFPRRHKPILTG